MELLLRTNGDIVTMTVQLKVRMSFIFEEQDYDLKMFGLDFAPASPFAVRISTSLECFTSLFCSNHKLDEI